MSAWVPRTSVLEQLCRLDEIERRLGALEARREGSPTPAFQQWRPDGAKTNAAATLDEAKAGSPEFGLGFGEALAAMRNGRCVRRVGFDKGDGFFSIAHADDDRASGLAPALVYHSLHGKRVDSTMIDQYDIMANDWCAF
jgi:hypothetical protein